MNKGEALDLGAGQGRNTTYLASKGFHVKAVDLSRVGIDTLNKSLKENNLNAEAIVGNMTEIEFDKNYDLIISSFSLFNLPPDQAISLIHNIKQHTKIGGLNAISTFTKDSDYYRNEQMTNEYYPETGELKNLYMDWEILRYGEAEIKVGGKRPGIDHTPVINTVATLLARKTR